MTTTSSEPIPQSRGEIDQRTKAYIDGYMAANPKAPWLDIYELAMAYERTLLSAPPRSERPSQKCPHCQEGWQHPSAERPGSLVCNICGRYDGTEYQMTARISDADLAAIGAQVPAGPGYTERRDRAIWDAAVNIASETKAASEQQALSVAHDELHKGSVDQAHLTIHRALGIEDGLVDPAGRKWFNDFDRAFNVACRKNNVLAAYIIFDHNDPNDELKVRVLTGGETFSVALLKRIVAAGMHVVAEAQNRSPGA